MKKRSGQILILVLLVVVVALAVGLSIASRNITNLRTSTQTAQSQRSFSAAEGGVEDVLSRLQSITSTPTFQSTGTYSDTVTVGDIVANVNIKAQLTYETVIELGDVGQVKLDGATGGPIAIQIDWVKANDSTEYADPATLELTVLRIAGGSGNLVQDRYAVSPVLTARPGTLHGSVQTGPFLNSNSGCSPTSPSYSKCVQISFPNPVANARILRIRPFWNKTTVRVTTVLSGTSALPVQTYDVTSTATTELGVTRKVQVTRTALPQLPAVFDYALYSDGSITK